MKRRENTYAKMDKREDGCVRQVRSLLIKNDFEAFKKYIRVYRPTDEKMCARHSGYRRIYGLLEGIKWRVPQFENFFLTPTAIDMVGYSLAKLRRVVYSTVPEFKYSKTKMWHLRCLCFDALSPARLRALATLAFEASSLDSSVDRWQIWVFYTGAAFFAEKLLYHYELPMSLKNKSLIVSDLTNLVFQGKEYRKRSSAKHSEESITK